MSYQLCYASRATADSDQLMLELRNILTTAMRFNYHNDIQGVLYYADHHFFQCLEGEKDNVLMLVESIKKDKRHTDFEILSSQMTNEYIFNEWSMKFVRKRSEVMDHFESRFGVRDFNPYLFNNKDKIEDFLVLLAESRVEAIA